MRFFHTNYLFSEQNLKFEPFCICYLQEISHRPLTERTPIIAHRRQSDALASANHNAIGFGGALAIPGVIEFSLCLFFSKLVSYTFLYWLPNYIEHSSEC